MAHSSRSQLLCRILGIEKFEKKMADGPSGLGRMSVETFFWVGCWLFSGGLLTLPRQWENLERRKKMRQPPPLLAVGKYNGWGPGKAYQHLFRGWLGGARN